MEARRPIAKIFLILVLIVILAAGAAGLFLFRSMAQPYNASSEETRSVKIPEGTSVTGIGQILEDEQIIRSADLFRLKARIDRQTDLKAGTYDLSPSMTMDEILDVLEAGIDLSNTVQVTIPEGDNLKQIAAIMAEAGICTEEEFLDETQNGSFDYDFISDQPRDEHRLEGFLYPDTYMFYQDAGAHAVIDKLLQQFEEVYNRTSASADKSVTSKYSQLELVTVASLVEREARLDEERPLVASVVYNRLDQGMKLQFCSTVQYALGKVKQRLYNSDLQIESPYNTYLYDGLPPGPIASPGEASLKAALNPETTDYLFFVADASGDGSHNFAATGDEFSAYREDYLSSLTS